LVCVRGFVGGGGGGGGGVGSGQYKIVLRGRERRLGWQHRDRVLTRREMEGWGLVGSPGQAPAVW
jgi:hypothetical protein